MVEGYGFYRDGAGRYGMNNLKPCPFNCGCNLIAIGRDSAHKIYMVCVNCDARGPLAYTEDEAEELWNRRAE